MAGNMRPRSKTGWGCLTLLSLPFAAVGVGMGVWLASTFLTYLRRRIGSRRPPAFSVPS